VGTAEGRGALGGRQLHTDADAGGQGMHRKGGRSRLRVRAPDLDAVEGGPSGGRRRVRPDGDGALDPVRRSEGGRATRPSGCPSMPNGYHPRVRQLLLCPPASGAASHTRRRPSNARSATGSSGSGVRTATSRWASTGTGASETLPNRSEVSHGARSRRGARVGGSSTGRVGSEVTTSVYGELGSSSPEAWFEYRETSRNCASRGRATSCGVSYLIPSCSPPAGPSVSRRRPACSARPAGGGPEPLLGGGFRRAPP